MARDVRTAALLWVALAALSDGHLRAGNCYDPNGLCKTEPCPAANSCNRDSNCPEGFLCRPSCLPSSCFCNEAGGTWGWGCTLDCAWECYKEPEPTGPRGYTITDLGTLGGWSGNAHAINDLGQIVGEADTAQGTRHAFLWQDGLKTDIGLNLPPPWSSGWDINNAAQVLLLNGDGRSLLWDAGSIVPIGGLNPGGSAWAQAINDAGQIVGYSPVAISVYHGFLWDDGAMTDLTSTLGIGGGWGINNLGHVASSVSVGISRHAAIWDGERVVELGSLGGESGATGVNDLGHVIGLSQRAQPDSQESYGFLWVDGEMFDLAALAGSPRVSVSAINNCGEVLGNGAGIGLFLFHPHRGFRPLSDALAAELRWYSFNAQDVNDFEQVVGYAFFEGRNRAFLMSPQPGDINRDGRIDLHDLAELQVRFTGSRPPALPGCENADADRDGDVDLDDLAIVLETDPGACCLPEGGCVSTGQRSCERRGGTFLGVSTLCDRSSGACCRGAGGCLVTNRACCAATFDAFLGSGSVCPAETARACCLPDATCVNMGSTCCNALDGDSFGSHTCATVPGCPQER